MQKWYTGADILGPQEKEGKCNYYFILHLGLNFL